MRKYTVSIDPEAERDLTDIADYITDHDSIDRAIDVAIRIEGSIAALETLPSRGAYPKELIEYGIREFREIHFKPYRIVYRIAGRNVVILLIADGRRDMRTLLARRLLGA